MILLGDKHRLQSVQGPLLLLVGNKHAAFLAIKGSIDTSNRSKLQQVDVTYVEGLFHK